jgi:SAM-dependent methyltransferase
MENAMRQEHFDGHLALIHFNGKRSLGPEGKVRLYIMNENLAASDWSPRVAARGEKWRAQLSGMEAMLTPVDAVLVRALHLDAPYRIADIGCGGGGTALEILRRAPAGSVVHGFDISRTLIELARDRIAHRWTRHRFRNRGHSDGAGAARTL